MELYCTQNIYMYIKYKLSDFVYDFVQAKIYTCTCIKVYYSLIRICTAEISHRKKQPKPRLQPQLNPLRCSLGAKTLFHFSVAFNNAHWDVEEVSQRLHNMAQGSKQKQNQGCENIPLHDGCGLDKIFMPKLLSKTSAMFVWRIILGMDNENDTKHNNVTRHQWFCQNTPHKIKQTKQAIKQNKHKQKPL